MAAPLGNLNAATHGRRLVVDARQGVRYALPAPRLTKEYRFISKRVDEFRRELEDAVASCKRGVIDMHDACQISAACDHERARQFLMARLRDIETAGERQPLATLAQVMATVGRCVDSRNRCIAALGISRDIRKQDELAALYADPIVQDDPEDLPTDQNAAQSQPGSES